jgi:hypothetical protein
LQSLSSIKKTSLKEDGGPINPYKSKREYYPLEGTSGKRLSSHKFFPFGR